MWSKSLSFLLIIALFIKFIFFFIIHSIFALIVIADRSLGKS